MTLISLPAVAQSQTQTIADDCACESQVLPTTLAIVNGVTIGARDIEKATGESVRKLQQQVVEARKRELDLIINSKLLSNEAKKRGISTTKLLEQEVVAKVQPPPTSVEIRAFYDQNKARINGDFESVKVNIVQYLTDERQRSEARKFADGLRAASKTVVKIRKPRRHAMSRNALRFWQPSTAKPSRQATSKIRLSRLSLTYRSRSINCVKTRLTSALTTRFWRRKHRSER